MGLLNDENENIRHSRQVILQTQFKEFITKKGAAQVVQWQKRQNLHVIPPEQIIIPYHLPEHWSLVVSMTFLLKKKKNHHITKSCLTLVNNQKVPEYF